MKTSMRDALGADSPKKIKLKWGRILLVAVGIFAVAIAGIGFGVFRYAENKFNEAQDESIQVDVPPVKGPLNILVLGSDRRDVVSEEQRKQREFRGYEGNGQRSDTIMLIHLSRGKKAVVLSFPRDLRVRIPGMGRQKINAAYNGGPNLMIKTIKEYTGIPIHHYAEVNFASFQGVVDAVGGVHICVNRTYDDKYSGLKIDKPGCYDFNGERALQFVRARKVDPDGDYGRIRRQQYFIRQLMDRVTSLGFLLDVPKMLRTVSAVSDGLTIDKDLSSRKMLSIASKLRSFDQKAVDFRVVPSYPDYIGGVSYVIARDAQAEALFDAIAKDEDLPPYGKTGLSVPDPQDVTIDLLNGTAVQGLARKEATRLKALGYRIRTVASAERDTFDVTTIYYEPGAELKAQLLKEEFRGAKAVAVTNRELRADVEVVLGQDVAQARATATASPAA